MRKLIQMLWITVFVIFMLCAGITVVDKEALYNSVLVLEVRSSDKEKEFISALISILEAELSSCSALGHAAEEMVYELSKSFELSDEIDAQSDVKWFDAVTGLPPGKYQVLNLTVGDHSEEKVYGIIVGGAVTAGHVSVADHELSRDLGRVRYFLLSFVGFLEKMWMFQ